MSNKNSQWMPEDFENGLVSVIVPTYNRAHILSEALDSVWAQIYRPIELIVVDDGSSDDTGQVVDVWYQNHQRDGRFELRTFYQENSGVCSARNIALSHSKGEYIQFLDSDDAFYPEMIAQVVKAFQTTNCDFVLVGYDKICGLCGRTMLSYLPALDMDAFSGYMKGKLWGHTNSIARRRHLVQEIGPWNSSLLTDEDGDYWVRTILQSSKIAVVHKKLFAYLVRQGPRRCDAKGSIKSWQCYVDREAMFCEGIMGNNDIPSEVRGVYAQRLYERALSLYNEGLREIGESFGALAETLQNPTFTWHGKLIEKAWRNGRGIYAGYQWARQKKQQVRRFISGKQKKRPLCPVCGG